MNEMLKKFCSTIVSFGLPRFLPLASLLGSVLAIPLIMSWRLLYDFMPHIAFGLLLAYCIIIMVAFLIVSRLSHDESPRFVADKVAGLFFAFFLIPFSVRLVLVGFCVFHVIRVFLPMICKHVFKIDFKQFGTFVATAVYAVLSGLIANGLLHIMIWTIK